MDFLAFFSNATLYETGRLAIQLYFDKRISHSRSRKVLFRAEKVLYQQLDIIAHVPSIVPLHTA